MLLQTRNIVVERAGSPALALPDLQITTGQKILLLGPSGSGKTTLLSAIAGLLKPTKGSVSYKDKDIYKLSESERDGLRGRNFGFIFQTLHLLPYLTLRQNIELAGKISGIQDYGRADTLLSSLDLAEKSHRKPDALSQGEQQRAAIARAVFNNPSIIVADEPTSALDDVNAERVMKLLEEQARGTGAALLVATHDARISARFDNIIRLS